MEEWLKKLLASITQGPTVTATPPFAPNARTASAMPGAVQAQPPLRNDVQHQTMQATLPAGSPVAPPITQPSNQVPTSPPVTTSGNTTQPSLADVLSGKLGEYNKIATAPAQKQNPWLQALYLGLQGTQRLADPEHAPQTPIQWLGEAKKTDKLQRLGREIAPIQAQVNAQREAEKENLEIQNKKLGMKKTEADIAAAEYKRNNPGMETKTIDGVVYERRTGSSEEYKPVKGIPAPKKTFITLPSGEKLETTNTERVRYEVAQAEKEADRAFQTGKYNTDTQNDYKKDLAKWGEAETARSQQVDKWVADGISLSNQARELKRQAAALPQDTKEALEMNTKAAQLEEEGNKMLEYAKRSKPAPKPSSPTQLEAPKRKVSKAEDPYNLLN